MSTPAIDESIKQIAIEWLVRLNSPSLSSKEEDLFFQWLEEKAEHQIAYIEAESFWDGLQSVESLAEVGDANAKSTVIPLRQKLVQYQKHVAIAASMLLCLAVMFVQVNLTSDTEQYVTALGEHRHIILSDGSAIDLNTGSRVDVRFEQERRVVEISEGEVFFNVSHDKNRPFIVVVPEGLVRVVGTQFNIKTNVSGTQVSVLEGQVGIVDSEPLDVVSGLLYSPSVNLFANDNILLTDNGGSSVIQKVDAGVVATWREGKQVYNNVPFVDVIKDLNRYFFGELQLGDESLEAISIVAVLNLRDKQATVDALVSTFNLKAVEESEQLTVLYPAK